MHSTALAEARAARDAAPGAVDDLRDDVTVPRDCRTLGAALSVLGRQRILRAVGTRPSPRSHARPIMAWALADPGAAARWLAEHPAPVERDAEAPSGAPAA